ncbi:GNAT family N-acetyltransferase [Paenibacillus daejeonensis]|uniref:GNAT family N-acetyltransferase n=1 Tax=Paenibacillus daejeonensis TaxID=135193 RepID=UPI00036F9C90|nr:GNAT family N-acetyltransferase [Paenibacillus daejeonensis]
MRTIELRDVSANAPHLRELVGELDAYLDTLYPPEEVFRVDLDAPTSEQVSFVVAYADGVAVGCGAIKPLHLDSVELKRFYVRPAYRNVGLAKKILDYLEAAALARGCKILKLEAGLPQVAAMKFYAKNGYYEIERFGEYADCPSSVCMEKILR